MPQISVRLDKIGAEYAEMLQFWLGFFREHRDVLLRGELAPQQPELNYPIVVAQRDGTQIAAVYANIVVPMRGACDRFIVANGTYGEQLVIRCHDLPDHNDYEMTVYDCRGRVALSRRIKLLNGLHELPAAKGGLVVLRRLER
ncbi:hypothetical protein [Cohnella nanjingensis]|uniref:hypothetical protein n=1 Tax=Cohnella nanjingensis TaxID=1387779 RepID=UPI001C88651D|nr:hypothetical protein [Cohnella nanjingensis]